jgi:hypothetical protein
VRERVEEWMAEQGSPQHFMQLSLVYRPSSSAALALFIAPKHTRPRLVHCLAHRYLPHRFASKSHLTPATMPRSPRACRVSQPRHSVLAHVPAVRADKEVTERHIDAVVCVSAIAGKPTVLVVAGAVTRAGHVGCCSGWWNVVRRVRRARAASLRSRERGVGRAQIG